VSRRRRRSFTRDFKLAALKRMAETDNIQALAEELGIERKLLYCWRDAYALNGASGLRRAGRPSAAERAEAALLIAETFQVPSGTEQHPPAGEKRRPAAGADLRRIEELERKIGEQQVALDFFQAALRHVRERRRRTDAPGEEVSTP
jgi:transposase